jgi:Zn ribbon nucleic-acid-binding protein
MANGPFANRVLSIACTKCAQQAEKTLEWLKANDRLVCAGCGHENRYDPSELGRAVENSAKAADDLARVLGKTATLTLKP